MYDIYLVALLIGYLSLVREQDPRLATAPFPQDVAYNELKAGHAIVGLPA